MKLRKTYWALKQRGLKKLRFLPFVFNILFHKHDVFMFIDKKTKYLKAIIMTDLNKHSEFQFKTVNISFVDIDANSKDNDYEIELQKWILAIETHYRMLNYGAISLELRLTNNKDKIILRILKEAGFRLIDNEIVANTSPIGPVAYSRKILKKYINDK